MKPRMFLVCGMPGSGKTHFAKKFATQNHIKYLNVDDFYAKVNGDETNRDNKFDVWIEFFKAIHEAELAGEDVVVETMALTQFNRKELTAWFPTFEHHMIYIDATLFSCYQAVQIRARKINKDTMDKYYSKLESPQKSELSDWTSIITIKNITKHFYYNGSNGWMGMEEKFPKYMLNKVAKKY